jgi:2-polyprenyl-3-methyl-5-hydroxy-6-metoxy-1,4-benzoquinol methylase
MAISDEYRQSMQEHHARPGAKWGATGFRYSGECVKHILRKHSEIKTVLDYGAGQCNLGKGICAQFPHLKWTDYDPAVAGIDVLPDGVFDLVVSTDCLEHVEPPLLRKTIREIGTKAGGHIFLDIPNEGTGGTIETGPYKGHDEHLTIENAEWWKNIASDCLSGFVLDDFSDRKVMLKGRPRPRTRMLWRRHGSW